MSRPRDKARRPRAAALRAQRAVPGALQPRVCRTRVSSRPSRLTDLLLLLLLVSFVHRILPIFSSFLRGKLQVAGHLLTQGVKRVELPVWVA